MSLIVADAVTQTFGAHDVLVNASLRLSDESRIGLVGPNGEGKTTLLRIIAGVLTPTSGRVQRKRGLRIGYLPQETPDVEGATLYETMLGVFADLRRMESELHELAEGLEADESRLKRYARVQEEFDARGGYGYTRRVETVLTGLAFNREQWDRPMGKLSGGERTRGHLGRLLLEEPDLLLLDEPTNHLDLESVEWLERWLQSYRGALVVVSHDRYFLDRTTSSTWEVAFGSLEAYRGSYSEYLTKREERYKERMREWEAQQEYIETTEDFIRRNIVGQRHKEAQGRRTLLQRFLKTRAISRPRRHRKIHLRLAPMQRTGDLVLRATDLTVGYSSDAPLLTAKQLEVRRGDRVAVVGPNGIGKTTLLRTLLGRMDALSGTVKHGANVRIGYLSQTHEELRTEMTVLETLQSADPDLKPAQARTLLGALLFTGDEVFKRIGELSGGQRSRVALGMLVVRNANVLVLDEPTNHLDVPSQEVLQDVLQRFAGTVVFVSHDRYLMDALGTHVWVMDGRTVVSLPGRWEAYVRWRSGRAGVGTSDERAEPGKPLAPASGTRGDAYRERRRLQNRLQRMRRQLKKVEKLVHQLEADLAALHDEISQASQDGQLDRVRELGEQYGAKDAELKTLLREWEQLSEGVDIGDPA